MFQLKKSHFKYPQCQGGGLHEGEILNLVCVDDRCLHRGLVCPVCKMQTHDDHYILPIKTFLSQIQNLFSNSSQQDQPKNIGDYLRAIESTKKQLLGYLKEQIFELSMMLKQIQMKIQSSYISVSRNILIQSSLTTKLPSLLTLLTSQPPPDPFDLQNQFHKYCQLIKYRDGKIKLVDKTDKIVDIYCQLSNKLKTAAANALADYRKCMLDASKVLQSDSIDKKIEKKSQNQRFKFSPIDKHTSIELNSDCTEAWVPSPSQVFQGFVMVDLPFTPDQTEAVLTVVKKNSYILVGIGNINYLKVNFFQSSGDSTNMSPYILSDASTSDTYNYSAETDVGNNGFEIADGDRITIKIHQNRKVCTFTNQTTNKHIQMILSPDFDNDPNYRLCIGLGAYDHVKLEP